VKVLINKKQQTGYHSETHNLQGNSDFGIPGGPYILKIQIGTDYIETKSLIKIYK
jgi:hypothetical protein